MSELRERFRALDALDVPDVMSRARMIGPKPPEPDRAPPMRRVGALVFAAVVAIAALILVIRALNEPPRPADPNPTPTDTALRRDGEVITYTGDDPRTEGDLVAQDPDTGEMRTLVAADALSRRLPLEEGDGFLIGSAAWSADGRWVAFEVVACGGGFTDEAGTGGLWVTNGLDAPRQLTKPCFEDPDVAPYNELWAWSPAGAQLLVARRSIDGNALVLIDPATGDRTDLGEAAGDVTALEWSPDGTRIAYGTKRGSVYSVGVGGGDGSLLASFPGFVAGGIFGSGFGITWSPDGAHIAVLTEASQRNTLYLMNADGSDLHQLAEDLEVQSVYWSPNLSWSPDGTRMAYATSSGGRKDRQQIRTASSDGSTPSLLFEAASAPSADFGSAGSPVWSPDGERIAFGSSTTDGKAAVWMVANADGTGLAREVDELRYLSWRGGWYFCGCYG